MRHINYCSCVFYTRGMWCCVCSIMGLELAPCQFGGAIWNLASSICVLYWSPYNQNLRRAMFIIIIH